MNEITDQELNTAFDKVVLTLEGITKLTELLAAEIRETQRVADCLELRIKMLETQYYAKATDLRGLVK